MNTEGKEAVSRAFAQIMRERTGSRWEIEWDRSPSPATGGEADTGASLANMKPSSKVGAGVAASHEDRIEGGGQ